MQMTLRDERMLEWLQVVRLADMDAVRWALAGFDGVSEPVSLRRAQQWVARLVEAGLLDRGRPTFRDGSIVWATYQVTGKARPNLFKQTTRHEVAVAAVSARFVAAGHTWRRDRVPPSKLEHMADGAATLDERVALVEVELTTKTLGRYQMILPNHARRVADGEVHRVIYIATPEASRAISREAAKWVHPTLRGRIVVLPLIDVRGHLTTDDLLGGVGHELVAVGSPVLPPPPVAQLPVWGGRD